MTSRGFDILSHEQCMDLLARNSFGRIGLKIADDPVVLPVYYALVDDAIAFRTDPGTKLIAAVLETCVAFEVDSADDGWSVLVVGHAHEVRSPAALVADLHERLDQGWPVGERDRIVRVDLERVTGRALRPQ